MRDRCHGDRRVVQNERSFYEFRDVLFAVAQPFCFNSCNDHPRIVAIMVSPLVANSFERRVRHLSMQIDNASSFFDFFESLFSLKNARVIDASLNSKMERSSFYEFLLKSNVRVPIIIYSLVLFFVSAADANQKI